MDKKEKQILDSIHFLERFQALCDQYNFDLKESFVNYDNQKVLEILQEIGYTTPKHQKKLVHINSSTR